MFFSNLWSQNVKSMADYFAHDTDFYPNHLIPFNQYKVDSKVFIFEDCLNHWVREHPSYTPFSFCNVRDYSAYKLSILPSFIPFNGFQFSSLISGYDSVFFALPYYTRIFTFKSRIPSQIWASTSFFTGTQDIVNNYNLNTTLFSRSNSIPVTYVACCGNWFNGEKQTLNYYQLILTFDYIEVPNHFDFNFFSFNQVIADDPMIKNRKFFFITNIFKAEELNYDASEDIYKVIVQSTGNWENIIDSR